MLRRAFGRTSIRCTVGLIPARRPIFSRRPTRARSPGLVQHPAGAKATAEVARPRAANSRASQPPSELPTRCARSIPAAVSRASISSANGPMPHGPAATAGAPRWPAMVAANTSWCAARASNTGCHTRQEPFNPCSSTNGLPEPDRRLSIRSDMSPPSWDRVNQPFGTALGEGVAAGPSPEPDAMPPECLSRYPSAAWTTASAAARALTGSVTDRVFWIKANSSSSRT